MNNHMDKFAKQRYIDDNKDNIIAKYKENASITSIAKIYNVAYTTIYYRLVKWGVPIRKHGGARQRRKKPAKHYKRKYSPELLAKMAYNSKINEGKVRYFTACNQVEDERLVCNIINHPIIG